MTDIPTATIPHYHQQGATLDERVEIPEDAPLAQGHDEEKAADVREASDAFKAAVEQERRAEAERAEAKAERQAQGDERQTAQADDDVPDGSIDEVTDWVGDDHDRAQRALEVENAKSTPRTSLVSKLEAI